MPEPIVMTLGAYIMPHEAISTTHFIKPFPPVIPTLQPLILLR
jgi:hypothetical protein